MLRFALFCLLACVGTMGQPLFGQQPLSTPTKQMENKSFAIGTYFSSRGLGLNGVYKSAAGMTVGLSAFTVHSMAERKIDSRLTNEGRRYVFGKTHNFYVVSPTIGAMRALVPARTGTAMSISVGWFAGVDVGFLRPYYLQIVKPVNNNSVIVVEPFTPGAHTYDGNIVGRGRPTGIGWDATLQYGIVAGANTILDFSRSQYGVSALDFGIRIDAFAKPVQLMQSENSPVLASVTIGLLFGTKW
jgi:hypothetical protein